MTLYIDKNRLKYNVDEIVRYMGAARLDSKSSEYLELKQKVQKEIEKVTEIITPRYSYIKIEISNGVIQSTGFKLIGKDILHFLHGINTAYIMVVTIGQEFEMYVKKQKLINNNLNNLIVDAIGTQVVEECADIVEESIRDEGNASVSSRYSPGYGDFPLDAQREILNMADANSIGVYCNEASMMFPQKTVTAIVKYAAFNSGCNVYKCDLCKCSSKCEFRNVK